MLTNHDLIIFNKNNLFFEAQTRWTTTLDQYYSPQSCRMFSGLASGCRMFSASGLVLAASRTCPCPPTSRTLPAYRQLSSQQAAAYCQLSSQQPTAALPLTTLQLMLLSLNCGCEPWSMKARSSSTTTRPPRTPGRAAAASSWFSNKELLEARSLTAPKHNNSNNSYKQNMVCHFWWRYVSYLGADFQLVYLRAFPNEG